MDSLLWCHSHVWSSSLNVKYWKPATASEGSSSSGTTPSNSRSAVDRRDSSARRPDPDARGHPQQLAALHLAGHADHDGELQALLALAGDPLAQGLRVEAHLRDHV